MSACTLRDAINAANASPVADQITFAPSVTGTITLSPTQGQLSISDSVSIIGPGAAILTVQAGATPANEFRIFNVGVGSGDIAIEGLTLTGGRITADSGGAIRYQSGGTLTIRDSVISGNVAGTGGAIFAEYESTIDIARTTLTNNQAVFGNGGAVHSIEASVVVAESLFDNNQSSGSGGAISAFSGGSITIVNSTLTNNRNTSLGYNGGAIDSGDGDITISGSTISGNSNVGGDGGAIYSISGAVTISSSTLDGNIARYNGGAILNEAGPITITDSSITNNRAQYGDGGGISNFTGKLTITRSTISGNSSVTDGGGISNVSAAVIIRDTTIDHNTGGGDGGGIATITGPVTIINSTISTNTGNVRGGGIQTDNAQIRLINSTLTANVANISGGGIGTLNDGIFVGDNFAAIDIENSIVAANASPTGPDFVAPPIPANSLRVRNSLIGNNKDTSLAASSGTGGNFVGTPTSPVNPMLGPLALNGGTTRTHEPAAASLAVDGGDNSLAISFGTDGAPGGGDDTPLLSDQRGGLFERIANAGGGGATVDMGSVERQARPILTVDTTDDESDGNLAPGDRSLRELIELANASDGFDTIIVPASIGNTITLTQGLGALLITDSLSIIGPGASAVRIINGAGAVQRLIDVSSTAGNVTISGLRLSGGNAEDQNGGAIRSASTGALVLKSVELSGNTAANGGAVFASAGSLSIAASLVAENTATVSGGGVAIAGTASTLTIVDSTISTNNATVDGGGISVAAGAVTIDSTTITLNHADGQGGGLRMATGSTSLGIFNSIVAANTAAVAPDFNSPQNPVTNQRVEFSLIGSNAGTLLTATPIVSGVPQPGTNGNFIGGGSGALISPQLGPLASNGGTLRSHSPLETSPAIDRGSATLLPLDPFDVNGNANLTEVLPVDVRVATRVVGTVDMGSVELAPIPVVTWNMPADIVFGTALGATQLNAVSTAAGTFAYTPVAGTMLSAGLGQTLTAVFTPNDPFAFRSRTVSTTINVTLAQPVVTWTNPSPIAFGTALGATQLNATADVAGTFVYTPASGTVLDAGAGQLLSVRFTPTDANFEEVIETVMLDVTKAAPTITWANPADISVGTSLGAAQLNATASVPGTFVYSPVAGTVLAAGNGRQLSVTFTPTDSDNFSVATASAAINVIQTQLDDYGDAPTGYPVLLADNGASHTLSSLRLGATVEDDADGQPSSLANADTDDGVTLIADPIATSDTDTIASFLVNTSGAGFLDAWLDFGADDSWDAEDRIANRVAVVAGANVISFTVPSGTFAGTTFARFRLSTAGGLAPTGAAADGEVEDYLVEILDGDSQADAIVTVPSAALGTSAAAGIVEVVAGDVVVRAAGTIIFRSPTSSLTELIVSGTNLDDSIELKASALTDDAFLLVDGGIGVNKLVVNVPTLDLTNAANLSAVNFAEIDARASGANTIKLSADVVSNLSPGNETITVMGDSTIDRFSFTDANLWRMVAPEIEVGVFVLIAAHQTTGQKVRAKMTSVWQNILDPSDVNNSGGITASDALVIINELGRRAFSTGPSGALDDPLTLTPFPGTYYDQNGDGNVTALDALRVINQLARISNSGEGERLPIDRFIPTELSQDEKIGEPVPSILAQSTRHVSGTSANSPSAISEVTTPFSTAVSKWADQVDQSLAELMTESEINEP